MIACVDGHAVDRAEDRVRRQRTWPIRIDAERRRLHGLGLDRLGDKPRRHDSGQNDRDRGSNQQRSLGHKKRADSTTSQVKSTARGHV